MYSYVLGLPPTMLNVSIGVTVLRAWTEIHGINSMKSEAKHAYDSYFATVTKIMLCFLHGVTASGSHFTVVFLSTLLCLVTILQGFPTSEKIVFLHSLLLLAYPPTIPFTGFCNSWDLSFSSSLSPWLPQLHSCQVNMVFRKEKSAWQRER